MSALSDRNRWTKQEYLAFEYDSPNKHELIDGDVYMMTGASENHNLIVASLIITLGGQLRGRSCKLYPSDMLVEVAATGDHFYPDLSIVCRESEIIHQKQDILLNPALIIEVLSPSTESYDRGTKFESYRKLSSLQEYVLVAQDRPHIERYVRQEQGMWLFSEVNGLDAVMELSSIGCTLSLVDVYERVTLPERPDTPQSPSQ